MLEQIAPSPTLASTATEPYEPPVSCPFTVSNTASHAHSLNTGALSSFILLAKRSCAASCSSANSRFRFDTLLSIAVSAENNVAKSARV